MQSTRRFCASDNPRGFSIIYIPLILLLLVAFVAMAVDTGRIRLAKAQLQGAADAAARAGATGIPLSIGASSARAKVTAELNPVAETNVVFDQNADIEWGTWNGITFTPIVDNPGTTRDDRDRATACHTFARAQSSRNTSIPLWITPHVTTFDRKSKSGKLSTQSNLQTEAVATIGRGPLTFGFVGINSITASGNNASAYGSLASDGPINLGNADVTGDVRAGIGQTLTLGPNSNVSGWIANLDYSIAPFYPPVTTSDIPTGALPVPAAVGKMYTFDGSNNVSNPTIYTGTIDKNTDITVNGYVRIYVDANLDIEGSTIINTSNPPLASRLEFYVIGSHSVSIGGNSNTYAHVYAPQSDVTIHGTGDVNGWVIGKTLRFVGTSHLHYDGTKDIPQAWKITLVK